MFDSWVVLHTGLLNSWTVDTSIQITVLCLMFSWEKYNKIIIFLISLTKSELRPPFYSLFQWDTDTVLPLKNENKQYHNMKHLTKILIYKASYVVKSCLRLFPSLIAACLCSCWSFSIKEFAAVTSVFIPALQCATVRVRLL